MAGTIQVHERPARPTLIYDGECTFCRYWVERWRRAARDAFDFVPLQAEEVARAYPELSQEALSREVHLIDTQGRVTRGAEAVLRALALGGGYRWLLGGYHGVPGFAPITETGYRAVATHRTFFSWLTRLFWGIHTEPPTFVFVRWLFLRGMGLCYLVAFLSLWSQVQGLIGSTGIVPIAEQLPALLQQAQSQGLAGSLYAQLPTLSWFSQSDALLWWQCLIGVVLSCLVLGGVLTGPCLLLLWMIYLSLATACGVFLGYQWDNLLLEAGLLSCWVAPWRWSERWRTAPPAMGRWLILWLLFRLMFLSGVVKLASQDPTWRNGTALQYHYETQPLPTWLGWYVHQWPAGAHEVCMFIMFAVELGVPFLIFGPRRLRFAAFWLFLGLMSLIGLTGNYGFFNLLAVVLCLWLLDDQLLLKLVPKRWRHQWLARAASIRPRPRPWPWWETPRRLALAGMVLIVAVLTSGQLTGALFNHPWPAFAGSLSRWVAPLRSVNGYGLFAVMTTTRPEIIIEGSNDGQNWIPYPFKYKAGDLTRHPAFAGFHMPRLDWQLWFAALRGNYHRSPWFVGLLKQLFEGSPDVLHLLESNPFPEAPPRYLRARIYNYEFTTVEQRRRTGQWWQRQLIGEYFPIVSLDNNPPP